ncbi:MAG: hypothetical protein K5907_04550 [Treponema sp.]|nr:hypothetical protein [Treponema sp.]
MKNSIMNRLKNSSLFKNILKVGLILGGCMILASFSPSLDGRAIVVEPGVFPEGLFAKTVGYLPGDIISVTNITGDSTVDILVIGALDPSEGVAIMLSPEAADAIGISRSTNNIVKITKRSNQDERVYGSAVIASQNSSAASQPAYTEPVAEEPEITYEEVYDESEDPMTGVSPTGDIAQQSEAETVPAAQPQEEIYSKPVQSEPEPVTEYEYFDDEDLPEYDEEPVNESEYIPGTDESFTEESFVEEEAPVEEPPVQQPVVEEPVEEPVVEEPVEEEPLYEEFEDEGIEELEEFEEETIEETPVEEPVEEIVEEPVEEPIEEEPEEEAVEEEIPEEEPVYEEFFEDDELEGIPEEEVVEEEAEEEVLEEEAPVEEEPQDDSLFEEETEEFEGEEPVEEEIIEEEPLEEEFFDEEPLEEPVEEPIEEEPVEEEVEEAIEEPVEEPAEEEIEEEPVEDAVEEVPEDEFVEDEVIEELPEDTDEVEVLDWEDEAYDAIVLVPADENPPEYIPVESDEPVANVTTTTTVTVPVETTVNASVVVKPSASGNETSYEKFVVESLNELEAERYYIQIATLRDDENILEIVNTYGNKYPITIVPTEKGTKQVLVGPVTLDEYGTVLARFKAYGYKDAFLRKGTNPNPKPRGGAAEEVDAK